MKARNLSQPIQAELFDREGSGRHRQFEDFVPPALQRRDAFQFRQFDRRPILQRHLQSHLREEHAPSQEGWGE